MHMNARSFREILQRTGALVFTLKDAARVLGKPPAYARLFLSRLARRGEILRVERGKYCLPDADELEVASNLVYPSYVSFLSALAFHRLTTQIPIQVQVACARQKKPIDFGGVRMEFIKLKKAALFGFRRFGNAFVAEPEKAVVDGLYLPERLPISEAFYALKQEEMDIGKLCEHAERLGSQTVKRRLGFLLEKAGIRWNVRLKIGKATRYVLLNPFLGKEGRKNKKWMIVENEALE